MSLMRLFSKWLISNKRWEKLNYKDQIKTTRILSEEIKNISPVIFSCLGYDLKFEHLQHINYVSINNVIRIEMKFASKESTK